jgi:hypothetical protein
LALLKPPLLASESADEFNTLYGALERDVAPRDAIERIYLADFCNHVWEIVRLRRAKVAIINKAYHLALTDVLTGLLPRPKPPSKGEQENEENSDANEELEEYTYADDAPSSLLSLNDYSEPSDYRERRKAADDLAVASFHDDKAKKQVAQLLAKSQLDESAIEAAAIKKCYKDLERFDKMMTLSEARRDKALRSIGEYRDFARRLRESSDRIIEGKSVLQLEHGPRKKSAAA